MYLSYSQNERLIYLCRLIGLEEQYSYGRLNEIYLLNLPSRVRKEIDRLPIKDRAALFHILFLASTDFEELKPPLVNKFQKDVWYFKIKSVRCFYVRDYEKKYIFLLRAYRKQGQKMPKKEGTIALSRRRELKI